MINDPPDGWGEMSYGEREAWRQGREKKHHMDMGAVGRLEVGQNVETPDGWVGFVAEKYPEEGRVYVESWERGGTYGASEVEPTGGGSITGGL